MITWFSRGASPLENFFVHRHDRLTLIRVYARRLRNGLNISCHSTCFLLHKTAKRALVKEPGRRGTHQGGKRSISISRFFESSFAEKDPMCIFRGIDQKYLIESWGLTLPFDRLIRTYFGCDEYTPASERTSSFVEHWADSPEKKGFLFRLGLYGNRSTVIQRRKAFKEGNFREDRSMPEGSSIKPFLDWVAGSFQPPIVAEAQVEILKTLCKTPQIKEYYGDYTTEKTSIRLKNGAIRGIQNGRKNQKSRSTP